MDQLNASEIYSPYRFFTAESWAEFRADTPLTLTADEVERLRSMNDPVDLNEVRRIYLALSRLLSSHVEASQLLFRQRKQFLNVDDAVKTPFMFFAGHLVAQGEYRTVIVAVVSSVLFSHACMIVFLVLDLRQPPCPPART